MIVDDEKGIREALKQVLEYEEIEVQACASGHEAIRVYPDFKPHLVFLDVKMEGMDGLETLKRIRQLDSQAQVVMISGHGTIQTAVEATQLGAYDFLEKPLDTDRILLTLRNALQHDAIGVERFLQKVVRAELRRFDRGLDRAVARDHDDLRLGIELADPLQRLEPVHPFHF